MQVYKAIFKIIMKNLSQILIYVVVFVTLTSILANTYQNPASTSFAETKVKMVLINHDTDSRLVEGLKNYLMQNARLVDIPDDVQKLQDALFFRQAEYIVRVPAGFSEAFLKGEALQLEKTAVPGSTSSLYLDTLINKYLNTAKVYSSITENLSDEQLVRQIDLDLAYKTEVKLMSPAGEISQKEKVAFFFNYLAYALFAILILGVCSVMIVFTNADLKKRNLCSPLKLRAMNFQMLLGNFSFAVLAWFALILVSFIMYRGYMFSARGVLFLLNSLVFTFAALSISYLLGNVIKSRGAMSAATNVISLGTCFISGVFVPQAFLGESVLKVASFTPNYWYVKSNNIIADLTYFNMESLAPIFLNMLIVAGFTVAVLSVTLVVIKQKRVSH